MEGIFANKVDSTNVASDRSDYSKKDALDAAEVTSDETKCVAVCGEKAVTSGPGAPES